MTHKTQEKMKTTITMLLLIILSISTNAQNCIKANSANFTNPSNDGITWFLNINWEADGQKHMNVTVNDGLITYPTKCFQSNSSGKSTGQQIYGPFITGGGHSTLGATLERYTGTCNGGTKCSTDQIIPPGGGLAIIFGNIKAENIGQNTIITFQAESDDEINNLSINYTLPDGSKEIFNMLILDIIKLEDIWVITINNKTKQITIKKK